MKKTFLALIIFGGLFIFSQGVNAAGCCVIKSTMAAAGPANCPKAGNSNDDCRPNIYMPNDCSTNVYCKTATPTPAPCTGNGKSCKGVCDPTTEESAAGDCSAEAMKVCCGPKAGAMGCCSNGTSKTPAKDAASCLPPGTFSPVSCPAAPVTPTPTPAVPTASPTTSPASTTLTFPNPIAHNTVESLVNSVLDNLRLVIAIIAILFVVIGGIMYMLSFGEEKKMETAKSIITAACIGFAIVLAAPSFLQEILTILGANNTNGVTPATAMSIKDIVMGVLKFLLSIVGILGIIGLVVGGIMYMTSYGEEDRMEKGKKILVASIIGIVIALGALVIVNQIAGFFTATATV